MMNKSRIYCANAHVLACQAFSMGQDFLPRRLATFGLASPNLGALRAYIAWRRNRLYVKSEKLWALLSSRGAKKILFSGNARMDRRH